MESQPVKMMRKSGILLMGVVFAGPAMAADTGAPAANTTVTQAQAVVTPSGGVRYVTDQFKVTLRQGAGLRYQIVRMLSTGDRLQVVQQDAQTGYTEVRTADGTQGWVLTRYLMNHPTARAQLDQARQSLDQANTKLKSVADTLSQTQDALKAKTQAEADLQGRYDALQKQYKNLRETAKNAVAVADENQTLKQRTATLSKRLSAVTSENETLKNTGLMRWFMAGGGVLLIGLILGLLMPHLVRRRRDNWFS
jgi:SH3 domain protein